MVLIVWALILYIITENIPATLFLMVIFTPFELLTMLIVEYLKALTRTH